MIRFIGFAKIHVTLCPRFRILSWTIWYDPRSIVIVCTKDVQELFQNIYQDYELQ